MLKLIIWGTLFYFAYRYFRLKSEVKEAQRREYLHKQQYPPSTHQKTEVKAEDIDYEEIK